MHWRSNGRIGAESEREVDDYLAAERYQAEGPGFHKFYDEEQAQLYFSYNDNEGNALLRSEGYTTESARDNGITSVEKKCSIRRTMGKGYGDEWQVSLLRSESR